MDISKITENIYVSSRLRSRDAPQIQSMDFGLIICMIHEPPPAIYTSPPFNVLILITSDSPFHPIPMNKLLTGARAALSVIQEGRRVLIYCREGRHRSVAMASAILIACGVDANQAMRLIQEKRLRADPYRWYIKSRIRLFEKEWHERHAASNAEEETA